MYAIEDISKFLKNSKPNLVMAMLGMDAKFPIDSIYDRILLARAWINAGKPEDKEEAMKLHLGTYWEAYTHPLVYKMQMLTIKEMLTESSSLNLTKDHSLIIKELLWNKLEEYVSEAGITRLETKKDFSINTPSHKLITFQLKSSYAPIPLLTVNLSWKKSVYDATVTFLDIGTPVTSFTPESLTKIKKLMYEVSEGWELNLVDSIVQVIDFDNVVLDCLMFNLKKLVNSNK